MDNYLAIILGIVVQYGVIYVNCKDLLCNERLIRSLPDDKLSASSSRGDPIVQTSPPRGRLNTTDILLQNGTTLMGGWSPPSDNKGHYIQATFDHMTMISEILTQGRHQGNGHVTMYTVNYTEDGTSWQTINNDIGVEQIFQGNSDSDTIQLNELDCPIFAKGIRILPVGWDTHVALRFDVTGCYVDTGVQVAVTSTTPVVAFANSSSTSSSTSKTTTATPPTTHTVVATVPSSTIKTKQTSASTQPTTVITTTRPSTTKMITTTKTTTTPTTKKTIATTTTRQTTTRGTTKPSVRTTTPYIFHPGIINPFGTTPKSTIITTVPTTMTTNPFRPGIPDPFGPGQLIG